MHDRTKSFVIVVCVMFFVAAGLVAQQAVQNRSGDHPKIYKSSIDLAVLANAPSQTLALPTTLQIEIEDTVAYVGDVPFSQLMTNPERTFSAPLISANVTAIGDVRRINGRPAKGLYVNIASPIFTTPNPSPENGFSISDATRFAAVAQSFDLQTADGTQIGSIFGYGYALIPTPGALLAAGGGSVALTAGTGPYFGIRGGMYTTKDTSTTGPNPSVRFASAGESPALRRVNKGGTTKFLLQIFPTLSADAVSLENGSPSVFHIYDESQVTRSNPAAPGEIVSVLVRNMGPTNPAIDFGTPFARSPLNQVSSPVDVQVNGVAADVSFAAGHPGTITIYDLEFRIPKSTPSGRAMVQVFVGYVGGVQFPIYVE